MSDAAYEPPSGPHAEAAFAALDDLRSATARTWPNIAKAAAESREKLAMLAKLAEGLLPTDEGALVVFGSLARSEFTSGSDLDWALLIDARADSRHLKLAQEIRQKLAPAGFKDPGRTEMFGGLVFSHELIHAIGGEEDSNKNMTRRLLLLLESAPVPVAHSEDVHNRIVNAVLLRYVEEDASFLTPGDSDKKLPRFLLNDVVRFWRTIAVDYANKYRVRAGEKWAVKNIKLRMSRKLLFVSGLFMCLSWKLKSQDSGGFSTFSQRLVDHLRMWTARPALESLAMIIRDRAPSLATAIFDSYDQFLKVLDDDEARSTLEQLSPEAAYTDKLFLNARAVSDRFDDTLRDLLFEADPEITALAKRYGVF